MIQSVISYLKGRAPVSALVGSRIFPLKLPSSQALPAIVVRRVSEANEHHLLAASGLAHTRVQISSYALRPQPLDEVSEAVRGEMDGFTGAMSTAIVRGCIKENELDDYEETEVGSDAGLYRNVQDYLITNTETIPTF